MRYLRVPLVVLTLFASVALACGTTSTVSPTDAARQIERAVEATLASRTEPTHAPTSTPRPKPTATPKPAQWVEVKRWTGTGIKTTESFSISGEEWRVDWTNHQAGNVFQIMVYRGDATPYYKQALLANTMDAISDTSYVHEGGEFYLTMNAMGRWTVVVEEKL